MNLRSSPLGGGDLGRRIIEQRERTGLSRAEAAEQAGMAASYLRYLETSPAPRPAPGDLDRLAGALGSTSAVLLGVGLSVPPGQSRSENAPRPEPLDPDQCWSYLADGGIGRFVYATERGPVAVPVNFRTLGKDVVFRTAARAGLAAASWQPQVSFEIDNLDDTLAEGWSVLVSGQAMIVTAPGEVAELSRLEMTPWAGGDRNCYIKIVASEITGRRIRRSAGHPSAGHASHAAQG
jgi:nitroimidazol reductase NimA-like FMN-containing flavoprotein (pyridoxamine 5'-phosphate oxidase superfamily)